MLCSAEIKGCLRESDHGAREGVQDKWLLAPLGHRGDMFETAEERSKNGIGGIGRLTRIRYSGGLSSSSSSLSFLLWCCCLYGYWHVDTQRDQSISNRHQFHCLHCCQCHSKLDLPVLGIVDVKCTRGADFKTSSSALPSLASSAL